MRRNCMTFTTDLAQYRILLILAELDEGPPKSARELADAVHMDRTAVAPYLKHIGARLAELRRLGGNFVPAYDMKPLPPVRRPRKLSETVRKRQYWKQVKADPVRHTRVKALQRIRKKKWPGRVTLFIDGNVNTG